MALKDVLKVSVNTFFNPSAWIGYRSFKYYNQSLWEILKSLFTMPKQDEIQKETFEQAIERLNLTEANVRSAIRNFRFFAIFFAILALLVFVYSFYLLFKSHFIAAWFLGMASSALFLAQAYKYDFWSFQMKRRKLGATFDEWKRSLLGA